MRKKKANDMNNMEIKQGDKVRVSKDAPRIYTPDWVDAMFNLVLKVTEVEDGNAMVEFEKRTQYRTVLTTIPCKYLVKVDAEAKEAKFKKGDKVKYIGKEHPEYWGEVFTVDGEIFYNDYHKNMQIDSVRCENYNLCNVSLSDLVLYTEPTEQTEAEKTNHTISIPVEIDPSDSYWDAYAAESAVSVANAVVEGLKRE